MGTAKVETTEAITEENVTITSTENETHDAEDQTTTEIMAEILKYPTTTETILMTEDTGITSTLSPNLYPSNTEILPTTNTVDYTDETTTTMSSTTTEAVLTTEVTEITSTLSPESYETPTEIMQEYPTKNETRNVDTPIFPTSTEDNPNAEVIGTTTTTSSPESSQTTTELIQEILTTMSPSEVIPI